MSKTTTKIRDSYIRVDIRAPGDYGWCSIGGAERSIQEEKQLLNEAAEQIRRHVDGIIQPEVILETYEECECGHEYEIDPDDPGVTFCCGRDVAQRKDTE